VVDLVLIAFRFFPISVCLSLGIVVTGCMKCVSWVVVGLYVYRCSYYFITGPPTHSVGAQTSNGRWRLSSSSVTLYGRPAGGRPGDDVMPPAVKL